MSVAEKIVAELKALPEAQQAEVLDFIEFLAAKHASSAEGREADREWMADEPETYSVADLKERFS